MEVDIGLNLVFLSTIMAASKAALVAAIVEPLLFILDIQTMLRAFAASQTAGRAFLWVESNPKIKLISLAG